MLEPQVLDRLRDAIWLGPVQIAGRLAGLDRAVGAATRALIAQDKESRGARVPALALVGTARLLADGVELEVAHELADLAEVRPIVEADLDPVRAASRHLLAGGGGGADAALDDQDVAP